MPIAEKQTRTTRQKAPVLIEARVTKSISKANRELGRCDEDDDDAEIEFNGDANVVDFTRYMGETLIILHLFSGRRRHGDFQMACEWTFASADYNIMVLSIDMAISQKCDLVDETNVQFWEDQIRQGRVAGLMAGPPCETWSVARRNLTWLNEEDIRKISMTGFKKPHIPRPVRTRSKPWGDDNLTQAEYEQISVANRLLMTTIRVHHDASKESRMRMHGTPSTGPLAASQCFDMVFEVYQVDASNETRPMEGVRSGQTRAICQETNGISNAKAARHWQFVPISRVREKSGASHINER